MAELGVEGVDSGALLSQMSLKRESVNGYDCQLYKGAGQDVFVFGAPDLGLAESRSNDI